MKTANYKEIHIKYTPLVQKFVNRYPLDFREDLQQEAYFALYRAYRDWDPSRATFITVAYKYIRNACYTYVRDRAYIIRIPANSYKSGYRVECDSLDQKVFTDLTLGEVFGIDSMKDDSFEFVWSILKKLTEKGVITWKDFGLLYYRYFQQYPYNKIGDYFGCSAKTAAQRVGRTIQKIRPYFLGKKRI